MASPLTRLTALGTSLKGATELSNMSDAKRPNIILYTDSTPNGIKISIALEELGIVSNTLCEKKLGPSDSA